MTFDELQLGRNDVRTYRARRDQKASNGAVLLAGHAADGVRVGDMVMLNVGEMIATHPDCVDELARPKGGYLVHIVRRGVALCGYAPSSPRTGLMRPRHGWVYPASSEAKARQQCQRCLASIAGDVRRPVQ